MELNNDNAVEDRVEAWLAFIITLDNTAYYIHIPQMELTFLKIAEEDKLVMEAS